MSEPQTDTQWLEGTIEHIVWASATGEWVVLRVAYEGGNAVVVGALGGLVAEYSPEKPLFVAFEGRWEEHTLHGRQFHALEYLVSSPQTRSGVIACLQNSGVPGVGPAIAKRIVTAFGDETLRVLDDAPERLAEVRGVSAERAGRLAEWWALGKQSRMLSILLYGLQIGASKMRTIRARYGERAFAVVTQTPYRLAEDLPRFGFKTADRIALKLGFEPDSLARVAACVTYVVRGVCEQGDCWVSVGQISDKVQSLGVPVVQLAQALEDLTSRNVLVREIDGDRYSTREIARAERFVGAWIAARVRRSVPAVDLSAYAADLSPELGVDLDPSQLAAIELALRSPVLVLTGGPGTGKTTIVKAILSIWREMGIVPALASPTGRAARRLSEATGAEAVTLHRLLEFSPVQGIFQRDESNPLEVDGLVIDETSMVDVRMMARVLEAMPVGDAPLLLVGDADQLPSVGPGQVLRDLVESGVVPMARLAVVHRQDACSGIVHAASEIREGVTPKSGEVVGWQDFFMLQRSSPEVALQTIVEIVTQRLPSKGFDTLRDVIVLTPMRKGPLGVDALNEALRAAIFEDAPPWRGSGFRVGDRVMCTKNNYDLEVFNGELGRVQRIARDGTEIDFDGRLVTWPEDKIDQVELAYAMTIHKSQGSGYPAVVLALHTQHAVMLRRNLVYTALTRAERFFCSVGESLAWERAVARTGDRRVTRLVQECVQASALAQFRADGLDLAAQEER